MKVSVKRTCGHIEDLVLFGGKYDDQIARLKKGVCKDCYHARQRENNNAALNGIELPKLKGSDKQVKWANDIRAGALAELADVFERNDQHMADHLHDGGDMIAVLALIREASAKWWIDNRDKTAKQLALSKR